MAAPEEFNILKYLRADLIRILSLQHGSNHISSEIRLWLGLFSPRFIPVFLCRLAHYFFCYRLFFISKFISLINYVFFGIEISIRCPIGPGLFFPHTQGTVIGAWAIGANATIFQGVTLGAKELDFGYLEHSRPLIGCDVTIGSGAKVLGGVMVGDGVFIGANSVVLSSLPSRAIAAGIPARIIRIVGEGNCETS